MIHQMKSRDVINSIKKNKSRTLKINMNRNNPNKKKIFLKTLNYLEDLALLSVLKLKLY